MPKTGLPMVALANIISQTALVAWSTDGALRTLESGHASGWFSSPRVEQSFSRSVGLRRAAVSSFAWGATVKVLISSEEISQGVRRLAGEITTQYGRRPLTIVGVLTGSLVLLADLIRQLEMPLRVGLIHASSYRGAVTEPGPLSLRTDLVPELEGEDVLIVDDIFDTGQTLAHILEQLRQRAPRSLRSAVLLRKAERRQVSLAPEHVVFEIPNLFVVGYGLDYNGQFRNLPYVAALDSEDLASQDLIAS